VISEIRTYTIKRHMMPVWLQLFEEAAAHNLEHGIRLDFAGIDPESMGTFIWVRTFRDEQDRQEREAALYGSEWWQRVSDEVMAHVVNYEVRVVQTAFLRTPDGGFENVFDGPPAS
jgi:NIPSNAP